MGIIIVPLPHETAVKLRRGYYVHRHLARSTMPVSCCYAAAAIIQIRGQIYTHGPRDEEKYMKITSGNANSIQAVLELAAIRGVRYPYSDPKKIKRIE